MRGASGRGAGRPRRGAARSVARGRGRAKGTQELYDFEITTPVTDEFQRRVKTMITWLQQSGDADILTDDPAIASGRVSEMFYENIETFMSSRRKQREPNKGQRVSTGDLEKYKHAIVWYCEFVEDTLATNNWEDWDARCSRYVKSHQKKITDLKL